MPSSEFSLSSRLMLRSNSELVGVAGWLRSPEDGGRAYLEGVLAGVRGRGRWAWVRQAARMTD